MTVKEQKVGSGVRGQMYSAEITQQCCQGLYLADAALRDYNLSFVLN